MLYLRWDLRLAADEIDVRSMLSITPRKSKVGKVRKNFVDNWFFTNFNK